VAKPAIVYQTGGYSNDNWETEIATFDPKTGKMDKYDKSFSVVPVSRVVGMDLLRHNPYVEHTGNESAPEENFYFGAILVLKSRVPAADKPRQNKKRPRPVEKESDDDDEEDCECDH